MEDVFALSSVIEKIAEKAEKIQGRVGEMIILISGDRNWRHMVRLIDTLTDVTDNFTKKNLIFVEGGAVGADRMAKDILVNQGYHVAEVPAMWETITPRKSAGARRNRAMLLLKPDLVIGFHSHIEESSGTADMLTLAEKEGIEYFLVE